MYVKTEIAHNYTVSLSSFDDQLFGPHVCDVSQCSLSTRYPCCSGMEPEFEPVEITSLEAEEEDDDDDDDEDDEFNDVEEITDEVLDSSLNSGSKKLCCRYIKDIAGVQLPVY